MKILCAFVAEDILIHRGIDTGSKSGYNGWQGMDNSKFVVIALGGSIVVPHLTDEDGINVSFLREFRRFLLQELNNGRRFILIIGGGKTARVYNRSAAEVVKMTDEDLDWIGIHATRLNAHLMRTIFVKEAHPVVIDHDPSFGEALDLKAEKAKLFIASGWRPGWSTDYVAVRLAQKFHAKEMIDAGDTPFVYDKDPKIYKDAKPFSEISWQTYRKLIPAKWKPGLASPIDPVAARLAEEIHLVVKTVKGTDLENLKKAIEGKEFTGTLIS
ncbi:MAG: UMP kinase [Candidatus Wildermuthbacteria bacterium]|nr:UMP kinase [Candidatus Wildermuthbacteria bacterium]